MDRRRRQSARHWLEVSKHSSPEQPGTYQLDIHLLDFRHWRGTSSRISFRGTNTLDVFTTNRPSLLIGDYHVRALVIMTLSWSTQTQCYLDRNQSGASSTWKKANTAKMVEDLDHDLAHVLDSSAQDTAINNLWITFKTICLNNITKHVPTKWISSRFNQPWCNMKIKQLLKQKWRAFTKCKRSGRDKDRQRYRRLQKSTLQKCKSAYNSYVLDMLQVDSNSKKLCSFF